MHNRLGRLDRIYVRAPIYFLTACTAQRRPLLAKQDVHEAFIRFAKQGPAHGYLGEIFALDYRVERL